ncbi:reverse transcriptase domain-containing protein [Tanacetum coccineum]
MEGEESPHWVIRSKFKDKLANFMLKKYLHAKGLGEMLNQQQSDMHSQFSQILATLGKIQTPTPEPNTPTLAITTRSGITTRNPPYPNQPNSAPLVKNAQHYPKELTPKKGDTGSFTLPCLIGTILVKNALADLGVSINLMPRSLFLKLGILELKPTRMSIQLANRSIKYIIGICENLLVKIDKFIFTVDFIILEMDKDASVPIILGRPFLALARTVIDVHDGNLRLRVGEESVTFNIRESMKFSSSQDDCLYFADHTNEMPLEWKILENRLKPSVDEPPKVELKALPNHLEYAFLQGDDQLPVVISSSLSALEKRHKISCAGIKVDMKKIKAISKLPHPTNVKSIQSFLGRAWFYRRFIKDFSKITRPMTQLLMKDAKFDFSVDYVEAFETLKKELTKALIMVKPDWSLPFELMCDASDYAVGVVLGQRNGKYVDPNEILQTL